MLIEDDGLTNTHGIMIKKRKNVNVSQFHLPTECISER